MSPSTLDSGDDARGASAFHVGQRVAPSAQGLHMCIMRDESWRGTVTGHSRDGSCVRVLPDGRRAIVALHYMFLQLIREEQVEQDTSA